MSNKLVDNLRNLYEDVLNGHPVDLSVITNAILYIQCLDEIVDYYEKDEKN